MSPIRSESRQRGLTLVEMIVYILLSLVVMLGAGTVYLGVNRSFRLGARKMVAQQEASQLSAVISRRVRIASNFVIYNLPNRSVPVEAGDGLALLNMVGDVTYRFEWDDANMTLTDSTGARVTSMRLQNLQFSTDPVSPRTVHYEFQTDDETGNLVDIESAVTLRN